MKWVEGEPPKDNRIYKVEARMRGVIEVLWQDGYWKIVEPKENFAFPVYIERWQEQGL